MFHKLALNVAEAASPAMEVFISEAQLEMVVSKQASAESKRLTVAEFKLVLAAALGEEKQSILFVPACPNHPVRIRVADQALCGATPYCSPSLLTRVAPFRAGAFYP